MKKLKDSNDIPDKWSIKKISEIAIVTMGASPSSNSYNEEKRGLPLIQGNADCINRKTNPRVYTTEITKECEVGDIIMTVRAPVGAISKSEHNACIGRGVCAIKSRIDNEFLYQVLIYHENSWGKLSQGSTFEAISGSDIKSFSILVPPLEEQEKIAEILSTWDLAIEKQEQLVEKKKEFKKGLMQRLLSGEVRFKDFNDEWKTYRINKLTTQIIKKNKENKISLVLSVTNKRGFITQEEQFEKQVASKDLSNYKIITKGEFAYNPSRINVGSIDLLRTFEEGLLSPMYVIFKCNERLLSEYLLYWMNTNTFINQMKKYLSGSVRETLCFEDMGLMKIKLPTIDEQKAIVNVLDIADKEIELLEKELEALKLQKKGLMQRLLTGEVRFKV